MRGLPQRSSSGQLLATHTVWQHGVTRRVSQDVTPENFSIHACMQCPGTLQYHANNISLLSTEADTLRTEEPAHLKRIHCCDLDSRLCCLLCPTCCLWYCFYRTRSCSCGRYCGRTCHHPYHSSHLRLEEAYDSNAVGGNARCCQLAEQAAHRLRLCRVARAPTRILLHCSAAVAQGRRDQYSGRAALPLVTLALGEWCSCDRCLEMNDALSMQQ